MTYTAAVITVSDKGYRGEREDTSGPVLCALLAEQGMRVVYTALIPDDVEMIKTELIKCADELKVALVLTTGGTGFSPRDMTPEATKAVIDREVPGIPEAMRAESMKITPRGCLSRSTAGTRGGTLIINLPGSERAAKENFAAVSGALDHGLLMLSSIGSADCAATPMKKAMPSFDNWLREAKSAPDADLCGMYLCHNGVVRRTPKAQVRKGISTDHDVSAVEVSCDAGKVAEAIEQTRALAGIYYVRVWINEGTLAVGEDIMMVLIGGDIRPRVVSALEYLVGELKTNCITEKEISA